VAISVIRPVKKKDNKDRTEGEEGVGDVRSGLAADSSAAHDD
jgi:hypothetical protein